MGGGVVIGGGLGTVFGLSALGARDDFEASQRTDRDAHDKAASMKLLTNVAFIGGGVIAATGLVLVLTAPKKTSTMAHLQNTTFLGASPQGVFLSGSF